MSAIAISNIAWPADADAEALSIVAAAGYSGLEIAPVKVFGPLAQARPDAIRAYAHRTADLGLPIVALQGILFGLQDAALFRTDEEQAALSRALLDVAKVAGELGGLPCVFGAPKLRDVHGLPDDDAWRIAIAFFRSMAPLFAEQGSTLCFEANPTIYGCNFATHTAQAIELVDAVGEVGFGLHVDVGTILQNAEPTDVVQQALRKAVHLHVSQPHLTVVHDPDLHETIADLTSSSSYQSSISVEMKCDDDWRVHIVTALGIAKLYIP